MIGIKVNGRFLDLNSDTAIPFDINCDLLDFESIGGTISFPFYLDKTAINDQILDHAGIISSVRNKRNYDAEIFFKGIKIYNCKIDMTSTAERYEGQFTVDAALHYRDKDKLIGEVISKTIALPGKNADDLNVYIDEENDMVFPMMHFQDYFDGQNPPYYDFTNRHHGINYESVSTRVAARGFVYWANGFIPMFKTLYILKLLLAEWGYTLIDFASKSAPDLRKLILFNNVQFDRNNKYYVDLGGGSFGIGNGFPENVNVADHLPNISVSKFLQIIRSFGIVIHFDSNKYTCTLHLLKDVISDHRYEDWSLKAVPSVKIKMFKNKGFQFSFADSRDQRQKDNKNKLEEADIEDPVDQIADLPIADDSIINQVRLVREFNAYYICDEDDAPLAGPEYIWRHYMDAHEQITADGDDTRIELPWAPIREADTFVNEFQAKKLVDDGNGKIKLTVEDGQLDAFIPAFTKVAITNPPHADAQFVDILSIPNSYEFIVDANFVQNETNIDFTLKRENKYRLPDVNIDGNFQTSFVGIKADTYRRSRTEVTVAVNNPDFTPRLLFYHGLVIDSLNAIPRPIASSSGFDNQGNKLTEFSLRLTGEGGIYELFWEDIVAFSKKVKEIEQPVLLTVHDIINFNRFRKVMIDNNKFLVKRIKAELTMSGFEISTVEMYHV